MTDTTPHQNQNRNRTSSSAGSPIRHTHPVRPLDRPLIGRGKELKAMAAGLNRYETSNLMLLGPAGSGKTALVRQLSMSDTGNEYLELTLSDLDANPDTIGKTVIAIFRDLMARSVPTVLFIDEFHQITRLAPAALESLKPLLADGARRGIRTIAATTLEEYQEYIAPNQALTERFTRVNVTEPDRDTVRQILEGMLSRYGLVAASPTLLDSVITLTDRHVPAGAQPRKSLMVVDEMAGWHRTTGEPMDEKLLARVMEESHGVRTAMRVDATGIGRHLSARVLDQPYAVDTLASRLHLCVAGLNDPARPMGTFLFTGPTGVGKTALARAMAELLFGSQRAMVRFDMTEYARPDSLERFRAALAQRVWERPYTVILLDEIEKADPVVTRLLLQVIDDGRLSDRHGRQTSFVNAYLVMTTNAGAEAFKTDAHYGSHIDALTYVRRNEANLRRSIIQTTNGRFPPELLGRIDQVVPFRPLQPDTQRAIALRAMDELREKVMEIHGVLLSYTPRVLDYVVDERLSQASDDGGARQTMRIIATELACLVARTVNEHPNALRVDVDVDGVMRMEDTHVAESDAHLAATWRM